MTDTKITRTQSLQVVLLYLIGFYILISTPYTFLQFTALIAHIVYGYFIFIKGASYGKN